MIRSAQLIGSLQLAVVAVSACVQSAPPQIAVHTASQPAAGPCTPDDASDDAEDEWPRGVDSLRLTVDAPDMDPMGVTGSGESLTLDEIPAGDGRTVALFGLRAGSPAWRGVTRNVRVDEDAVRQVNVLMARLGDLSCARGRDDPRAFHTATVLRDGRVLVVGGSSTSVDKSQTCGAGCRQLDATTSAALYDPTTGVFQTVGPMAVARMFHTATLLEDGRVVVAGGAQRALLHGANDGTWPFPVEALLPTDAVEVFDPKTSRFTSGPTDPNGPRVFAAAALTGDGRVLVTGGIPAAALPNNLGNAMDTTTLCGGTPLSCQPGPTMSERRAGHVMFRVDAERDTAFTGVVIWGGSIEPASADGRGTLEAVRDGAEDAGASEPLSLTVAAGATTNVFFATAARYADFRTLVAGGLLRDNNGRFSPATTSGTNSQPGAVAYVFDPVKPDGGTSGRVSSGPRDVDAMRLSEPKFFAAAAPMPDARRALVGGGYSDLAFTPSASLDMFDQRLMLVAPVSVGGVARTLREARGGAVATANGDGTVVFFGGEAPVAGGARAPLPTAEIFADSATPPGVAE